MTRPLDPESRDAWPWRCLYGVVARLFPRWWRREFGADGRSLFLDLIGEARRRRGRLGAALVAARSCADLVRASFTVRRQIHSPSGVRPMRGLLADIGFAWRGVVRQPRHALLVIVTLGVGIGTVTTSFSLLDAAVLRRLPFPDAERLVEVFTWVPEQDLSFNAVDGDAIAAWRRQPGVFERLESVQAYDPATVIDGTPLQLQGARVTPGALPMLGARPVVGRLLAEADIEEGAPPAAVVSEAFWRAALGARPDLANTRVVLDGVEHRVVGVLASDFAFPTDSARVWVPFDPTSEGAELRVRTYGRLRAGLTAEAANELADRLAQGMAEQDARRLGWGIRVHAFDALRTEDGTRTALWLAFGAAGLMLGVSMINVVHVVLARIVSRERDLAVRSALGAGRMRIFRQVVLEVLFLSIGGGLVGASLSVWMVSLLSSLAPRRLVEFDAVVIGVDARSVGFALGVAVLAALFGSLLPAYSALRRSDAGALRDGPRSLSESAGHGRVRSVLVVTEAAAAVVLLVGAGLLVNTFVRLAGLDVGFDVDRIVSLSLRLDEERYPTPESRGEFLDALAARMQKLPGVEGATVARSRPPMPGGVGFRTWFETDAGETIEKDFLIVPWGWVRPDYFAVAGVPLVSGRTFVEEDDPDTAVILSEPFARMLFGDAPPVGRSFRTSEDGDWLTVVGIVEPVSAIALASPEDDNQMYRPLVPTVRSAIVVRVAGDPLEVVPSLHQAVWDLDPRQPISDTVVASQAVADWLREPRFYAILLGVLASLAGALAMVGIFGVVGHAVSRRTHEIGVRTALGASERSILLLAMRGGLGPAVVGLAIGMTAVAVSGDAISGYLHGIEPTDSLTLGVIVAVFLAAVTAASYLPARRATRVDPVEALRSD